MAIAAALVTAGASLIGGIANAVMQEDTNSRNMRFQEDINRRNVASQERINQQNLDFQRSMTQAQWERDDNAYQRQVSDLEKAGLSPLAATAGGAPNSSVVSSPALNAPQQFPSHFQAPQFDINSVINSVFRAQDLEEKRKENLSKQGYRNTYLSQKQSELSFKWQSLADLNKYRDKSLVQQDEHFLSSLELQKQQFEHLKERDLNEYNLKSFAEKNQMIFKALESQLPDKNLPHTVFFIHDEKSLEVYETAQAIYMAKFDDYLSSFKNTPAYKANASSSGRNGNANVSGAGLGFGVGAGVNNSFYSSESKDKNTLFNESWVSYCIKNKIKFPVPYYGFSK